MKIFKIEIGNDSAGMLDNVAKFGLIRHTEISSASKWTYAINIAYVIFQKRTTYASVLVY